MDRQIAVEIVNDVRTLVESLQASCGCCSVVTGNKNAKHRSCTAMPEAGEDFEKLKALWDVPKGTSCFKCLLPTVSSRFVLLVGRV